MFRCPSCGQAQVMPIIGEQCLVNTSIDKTGFGLEKSWLLEHQDQENNEWQEVVDEMIPSIDSQMADKGIVDVSCPKCTIVKPRTLWFKCWDDPLQSDDLETDNLCHCGSELWLDKIPGSRPPKFAFMCDKDGCGWIKPKEAISGSM